MSLVQCRISLQIKQAGYPARTNRKHSSYEKNGMMSPLRSEPVVFLSGLSPKIRGRLI